MSENSPSLEYDDAMEENVSLAQMLLDEEARASRTVPTLSKTRFMAGLQCDKRLVLESRHPELRTLESAKSSTVQNLGHELGALARQRWPGGTLISFDPKNPQSAVQATKTAAASTEIEAIFEATVISGGRLAAADALVRRPDGGWKLVEVKSGSKVTDVYQNDIGFQWRAFTEAGFDVREVVLLLPNKAYTLGKKGVLDPQELFAEMDVTTDVEGLQDNLQASFVEQRQILAEDGIPDVDMGKHCEDPHPCPFQAHCKQQIEEKRTTPAPRYPVGKLYRISGKMREALKDTGVEDIRYIPDTMGLSDMQKRQRESCRTQVPYRNTAGIVKALEEIKFPLHFLDFEAVNPAIPLFPNTRPYQILLTQFSNHTMTDGGRTYHSEYLHVTDKDPREAFIKKLMRAVKDEGSIVVYSSYEAVRLRKLAQELPAYAPQLEAIIARLVDLLPIVRNNTYHQDYDGSFSIKKVLPVFVPKDQLSYEGLRIKNGDEAAVAFMEMMNPESTIVRRAQISSDLRAYCSVDTQAMLQLLLAIAPEFIEARLAKGKEEAKLRRRGARRDPVLSVTDEGVKAPTVASLMIEMNSDITREAGGASVAQESLTATTRSRKRVSESSTTTAPDTSGAAAVRASEEQKGSENTMEGISTGQLADTVFVAAGSVTNAVARRTPSTGTEAQATDISIKQKSAKTVR